MRRLVAGALLATAAALACAQPGRPSGGEVDRSPPRVVAVTPAAFDTITDLGQPVVIRFDERISERLQGVAELREAVLVSPATDAPMVDQGRQSIQIRQRDGWEPDRVYRVVVRPVYSDLFGNQRQEPVELVFSTGAPITESALAGFVTDRITGRAEADARVEATRRIDGQRYVAVTDTAGFFAMRFAPAGAYDLKSWRDQDRDREPDFFEAQDTAEAAIGVTDTAVVELALLPMDTTPARLARVEAVDSSKLRLVFDDYFAPGPVSGSARLYLLPDTTLVTSGGRLFHATRLDSILAAEAAVAAARDSARREEAVRDSLRALRDSLAALPDSLRPPGDTLPDTVVTDTGARLPDTVRARGADPSGAGPAGQESKSQPLPSQELILVLPGVLTPDTTYYVEVEGVVNIRGLPDGGGAAPFRSPTAPADTAADADAAESSDSTVIPPDSGGGS
ncbi:MAG: carboxypeptidase-like regulatory domain-containing protein [Longimicrobiales bacterium]